MERAVCHRCHRDLDGRTFFALKSATGETARCFLCALMHLPTLKRSLATALVVGSILTALNQGDILFPGGLVLEALLEDTSDLSDALPGDDVGSDRQRASIDAICPC